MKKFVSMAMVAAMTTSMVPATAFAGIGDVEATAKIVDAWTMTDKFDGTVTGGADSVPELQIKITDTNYKNTATEGYYAEVTVALDNAELAQSFSTANIGVRLGAEAKEELRGDKNEAGSEVTDLITAAEKASEKVDGTGVTTRANLKAADKMAWDDTDTNSKGAANLAAVAKTKETTLNGIKTAMNTTANASGGAKEQYDAMVAAEVDLTAAKAAVAVKEEKVADQKIAINGGTQSDGTVITTAGSAAGAVVAAKETLAKEAVKQSDAQKLVDAQLAIVNSTDPNVTADQKTAAGILLYGDDGTGTPNAPASAATGSLWDDLVQAKADVVTAQGNVTAAETALTTAQNTLATLEKELADAKATSAQEIADAQTAYDTAKTTYDNKVTALTETAQGEYDAAKKAYDAAVAEYTKAYNALVEAEKEAGASIDEEDLFTITPVEGFPKAKTGASGEDEFTFGITGKLHAGDVIYVDLNTVMDKTSVGKQATLDVESDDLNIDVADLVYVAVEDYGITATVKKLANVAEEEKADLEKDLKIESTVGDFAVGQEIELKLNNGFEFDALANGTGYTATFDEDKAVLTVTSVTDEIVIKAEDMTIEATSAKSGDVATITVKAKDNKEAIGGGFAATAKVEVMKVVDYTVMLSVDEDEDIPVIYSGVNVANDFITDDSDHLSVEVTVEESFPGAWSMRKGFNFELPDGVYVTNVDLVEHDALYIDDSAATSSDVIKAFEKAYQDGDHKAFEFEKRAFNDVDSTLDDDCASMTFQLELVADPTFAGDVTLKFTGDLVDEQEVTIAKFMPIAVVEAEQNDMKIDYRYTEIPTAITVTETAAGLWEEGSEFWMAIDKDDVIEFEDGATFEATNGLEIDDFEDDRFSKSADEDVNSIGFKVEEESDEAATVTISNMSLFMQRNIPAGAYDLTAGADAFAEYLKQGLFAPDQAHGLAAHKSSDCDDECFITDVEDFSDVVKEAFVNVVTAGREQDDASFTTKVVVPVGESYIVAGENQVTLDVPAYVSAAGYTMLPVRAVATALGINNNNVIWNGETKTVTILYGQRIITMVAGQKVVNVNGSVIPASAAVEIVDGRTFLPMRDLATALGVTDITWDAATKTATLNGGVVAE